MISYDQQREAWVKGEMVLKHMTPEGPSEDYDLTFDTVNDFLNWYHKGESLTDTHGYPTERGLDMVRFFEGNLNEMYQLLKMLWWHNKSVEYDGETLCLATLGWSGNEDIIQALQENKFFFWVKYWHLSKKGGYYEFKQSTWHDHITTKHKIQ